ncbi:MAG: hypothetical protein HY900_23240 [Deltaproteobacteria bacterium]|nr:hypothetical protein [Deltaproteobacteria bacterium]
MAIAVCMSCRKEVCSDCATTFDGINYCNPCLAARRGADHEKSHWLGWVCLAAAIGVLFLATRFVMVWWGVLAARLL